MKKIYKFQLIQTKKKRCKLFRLCKINSILWNMTNYMHRWQFLSDNIMFDTKENPNKFKNIIGEPIVKKIIQKNAWTWKLFSILLKLKKRINSPKLKRKVNLLEYIEKRNIKRKTSRVFINNDELRMIIKDKHWPIFYSSLNCLMSSLTSKIRMFILIPFCLNSNLSFINNSKMLLFINNAILSLNSRGENL